MNNIELARQAFKTMRDDAIVERECAHRTEHPVGNANPSPREGGVNLYGGRKWPTNGARKHGQFGTGVEKALYLLPCRVADATSADLMGEAVKDSEVV